MSLLSSAVNADNGSAVLVVGSGGREHCIAFTLAKSEKVSRVFVAPGNGGCNLAGGKLKSVPDISVGNFEGIADFCRQNSIQLVFVGPEVPLADGIADFLKSCGISCFGPSKGAAIIEASKAWSKDFMLRNNIPTARYKVFTDFSEAEEHLKSIDYDVVIKASGLAAGKGVIIPTSKSDALDGLREMMVDTKFGSAGDEVVIEECLYGPETSILAFTDGHSFVCGPPSQDHKRVFNGDKGPNTGGMGAYAPYHISDELMEEIKEVAIKRCIDSLRKEKRPFVGVLYAGLMLTKDGPRVLEYNCRMGDPETQVILPLLSSDLYDLIESCVNGCLDSIDVTFSKKSACTVVAASGGYPGKYPKGKKITGVDLANSDSVTVFHAGTKTVDSDLVTSGGRVLAVTGIGDEIKTAVEHAYEGLSNIKFEGIQFRTDIAHQALARKSQVLQGATYADAGVDIETGDKASQIAYNAAKATFESRKGMIGEPAVLEGGFTGLLDMGDYYLVQGDDGVGTKSQIAESLGKFDTLGYDLLAMVCDDAICVGAETISITNTMDTNKVHPDTVRQLMKGLSRACVDQKIVIPGGEIAEVGAQVRGLVWNATAVGIVSKDGVITGANICEGDAVISLRENGFRSNGFSLARYILKNTFGSEDAGYQQPVNPERADSKTFGEALLYPSVIYSDAVLQLIGRFSDNGSERKVDVKGIVHVTGGGIPGNIKRVLKKTEGLGVELNNLFEPPEVMTKIQQIGSVSDEEAYKTWNMGNGMLLIVDKKDTDIAMEVLSKTIECKVVGHVTSGAEIRIVSNGIERTGDCITFTY